MLVAAGVSRSRSSSSRIWPTRGGAIVADDPPLGESSPVEDQGYIWSSGESGG